MKKDQLTFNDLPAYRETFQAVRNQRGHARPHDRTGGLQLS